MRGIATGNVQCRITVQPLLLPRAHHVRDRFKIRPNATRSGAQSPPPRRSVLRRPFAILPTFALGSTHLRQSRTNVVGTDRPPAGSAERQGDVRFASTSRSPLCFAATHSGRPFPLSPIQRPASPRRWRRAHSSQIHSFWLRCALAMASFLTLCCVFLLLGHMWLLVSEIRF